MSPPKMKRKGDPPEPIEDLRSLVQRRPPQHWEEVEDVLTGKVEPYRLGARPRKRPLPCEFCGKPTKWISWRNSDFCWQMHCGIAGWIEVCEDCEAWYPMHYGPSAMS